MHWIYFSQFTKFGNWVANAKLLQILKLFIQVCNEISDNIHLEGKLSEKSRTGDKWFELNNSNYWTGGISKLKTFGIFQLTKYMIVLIGNRSKMNRKLMCSRNCLSGYDSIENQEINVALWCSLKAKFQCNGSIISEKSHSYNIW